MPETVTKMMQKGLINMKRNTESLNLINIIHPKGKILKIELEILKK